jgi:hypothetical protein
MEAHHFLCETKRDYLCAVEIIFSSSKGKFSTIELIVLKSVVIEQWEFIF